jgi:hypothetical protein
VRSRGAAVAKIMAGIDEDAFLARLADVVRVPQANRARFFSEVRGNFKALHELERQLVHAPEIRSVGKIANELIRAILALDDEARSHLDRLLGGTVLLGQGMATSAFNPPSLPAKFTTGRMATHLRRRDFIVTLGSAAHWRSYAAQSSPLR